MKDIIRWGILGPGNIARNFVQGLEVLKDAKVVAVGSRSLDRANAFADKYNIPNAYGSYEELVLDSNVDIIYVATPHPVHKENTLLCLKAGKAVLCEKPFTINAKETEEIIKCARESKLFLMEAMWTRFLPAIVKVREWINSGVIGEIRMLKADFGFRINWNPEGRLLNRDLGGGALLDAGIYPVSFASMIFGKEPLKIASMSHIGETGVDEQFTLLLGYEEGRMASLSGACRTQLLNDAFISGTEGTIHIPDFLRAKSAKLIVKNKPEEIFEPDFLGTGKNYEAAEAMRCIREGKLESSIMPLDESLLIMKTMDKIREQWGLKYPFE